MKPSSHKVYMDLKRTTWNFINNLSLSLKLIHISITIVSYLVSRWFERPWNTLLCFFLCSNYKVDFYHLKLALYYILLRFYSLVLLQGKLSCTTDRSLRTRQENPLRSMSTYNLSTAAQFNSSLLSEPAFWDTWDAAGSERATFYLALSPSYTWLNSSSILTESRQKYLFYWYLLSFYNYIYLHWQETQDLWIREHITNYSTASSHQLPCPKSPQGNVMRARCLSCECCSTREKPPNYEYKSLYKEALISEGHGVGTERKRDTQTDGQHRPLLWNVNKSSSGGKEGRGLLFLEGKLECK